MLPEIEEYIDIIHKELLNGDILSLVEIDLFIEKIEQNYSFNEKKVLFYELMTYMRHNLKIDYYKSSIWAKISVYYARILLEDKDYWGCIKTCESGLSVTENRKRIVYAPELYSLLGQANNYLGKRSLAKEQFSVSSQLVNSFYKQREYGVIHELLQHYENIDN